MNKLDKILQEYENKFKNKSIPFPIKTIIPTGIINLDMILGIGGLLSGSIISINGNKSSGKTTLALHLIKRWIKRGLIPCYINAECTFNTEGAKDLGVDLSKMLLINLKSADDLYETVKVVIDKVNLLIIDSTAIILNWDNIIKLLNNKKCTIIFINQFRTNIKNKSLVPTGGKNIQILSDVILYLKHHKIIKREYKYYGKQIKIKVLKNQYASFGNEIIADFIFHKGFLKRRWSK